MFIALAVHNAERHLDQALSAIEAQTHQDWIGCIVDDGSTDGSRAIAERHAQTDTRWQVIAKPNGGAPSAINTALRRLPEEATAVAFCDSDDLWLPGKLEAQLAMAPDGGQTVWEVGTLVEEFEDFPQGVAVTHRARPGAHRARLRSNVLLSRAAIDQLGQMDESRKWGDFIEWMSPLVRAGHAPLYVESVLVRRRIHGENMTADKNHPAYLALLRAHLDQKRNGQ